MPAPQRSPNHAALAELTINGSQQSTFTEHYVSEFTEFLCALTSISTSNLNPFNLWDKLVDQPGQTGSTPPVKQYIESLDSPSTHRIYRPVEKSSALEKQARIDLSKAQASGYAALLTAYVNQFYASEFHTPPALCIYLDQHSALQPDALIELLIKTETEVLHTSVKKSRSLVNSTQQFIREIGEKADATNHETIKTAISEIETAIAKTDIFEINTKTTVLSDIVHALAQKVDATPTFTHISSPVDVSIEADLPQSRQLQTLFQLSQRLSHRQFAQLPLNQLLQIAHPLLNQFNRNDILAVLAYSHIECLNRKQSEIITRPSYSFEAFTSASLASILDDHPLKITFIQSFSEEAKATKKGVHAALISEKLAADIYLIEDKTERKKSDLFLLLSSPLQSCLNSASDQNEREELQEEIVEELKHLLAPIHEKFNALYQDWRVSLQKSIKATKTDWHHALNTLYFLNMYIAATTRYMNPQHILETLSPPAPLKSGNELLGATIYHANKMAADLECSPCPASVFDTSVSFFPGSTDIISNPEYWSIARKAKETAISTALQLLYSTFPDFEPDPQQEPIHPTHLQTGFATLLVDYFVPNTSDSANVLKDWIKKIYLPSTPFATKLFKRGVSLIASKKKRDLINLNQTLKQGNHNLTPFEYNQLLLYLLFYPSYNTADILTCSEGRAEHRSNWFLKALGSSAIVGDSNQINPVYQIFSVIFPPDLDAKKANTISNFFKSFNPESPCFLGKNSNNPTYLGVSNIMRAFEVFIHSTLESLALHSIYIKQQKPTSQKTFGLSNGEVQSGLHILWQFGGSIKDIFSCHRTRDHAIYEEGYQDKLYNWTVSLTNILPYLPHGDTPPRPKIETAFDLPPGLDSKELSNFCQSSPIKAQNITLQKQETPKKSPTKITQSNPFNNFLAKRKLYGLS
jgi:hypothetical protein